ncbi:MAG: DUF2459 domain-containing protein [Synechococcales cyanobacterium CRU_2_2]|nr:DUF2459 domain-containing protein [Synechococcales cyanobacterium CRU_2_2]
MRRPADPGLFHTAPGQACHRSLCHYGLSESRSLHTGLTLPVYTPVFDWRAHLDLEDLGRVRQQDYAYVSWGWGDRQFYVNTPRFQDLQLTTALRALFWPTDTAMEVRGDRTPPRAGNGYQVKALKLSETGYLHLVDYVLASLEQDIAGQLQPLGRRPTSTFYASRGWYGIWYTCNDWLATGLRAAEVRTPVWSGLAGSVLKQAQSNCIE